MELPDKIFLIGYMGSGKTTVGKLLARKLAFEYVDLDERIEKLTHLSIPEIFRVHGEDYFRNQEQQALKSLENMHQIVVATGGGCPAYGQNMAWMKAHGMTVYLKCKPGVLFHRIAPRKEKRPLIAHLDDVDIMEFILSSLKKRLPSYSESALTVNGEPAAKEVTEAIVSSLQQPVTSSSQDLKK
ncbi:MAG: shikimate kinase [Bacteroidia bacterium]|nr:shikimate kinase [Bacteroidia bacterium]